MVPYVDMAYEDDIITFPWHPDEVIQGGTLEFQVRLDNDGLIPQTIDAWLDITLPGGDPYPGNPVILRTVTIPSGPSETLVRLPVGNAPAGEYTIEGSIGLWPDILWDTDSFALEVVEFK